MVERRGLLVPVTELTPPRDGEQIEVRDVRFRRGRPGVFYVYAIYCRNDLALSYTTAWTAATGPTDPRIEQLFRQLFMVVFPDQYKRYGPLGRPVR